MSKGQIKFKFKKFVREDKGEGGGSFLTFFFISYIVIFFLFLLVNLYQVGMERTSMKSTVNEVMQIMKVENGADGKTKERFNSLLQKNGLDPSKVSYKATPKTVQRGDELEIVAETESQLWAAKMFLIDYKVPLKARATGLAHKYIREGGS